MFFQVFCHENGTQYSRFDQIRPDITNTNMKERIQYRASSLEQFISNTILLVKPNGSQEGVALYFTFRTQKVNSLVLD